MASQPSRPLRAFAEHLRQQRVDLIERWMKAVFNDADLSEADRLTYEQLADHVPSMLEEMCGALEDQDLDEIEPAIEHDARQHGKMRWRQGYRIDEVVRELDLLRQVLIGELAGFAGQHAPFTRSHEARARQFVDETISFVTVTSIREAVTERERKIDEYTGRLERANHELALKERVVGELYESRMQITRTVVHDLRNFLNVFSMALQLIARAPNRLDAALTLANRQVADMKTLVDELVEYSIVLGDTNPFAVEAFDLRGLFDELVASCRPSIEGKGLRLISRFDPKLSTITSNRLKLKQVALNLLTNAAKYTKAGEVQFEMRDCGAGSWCLHVSDTGVGISEADRQRVFEAFERANQDDVPGAGLGLAIVRELCRLLQGDMRFASHEGRGTMFEITFPLQVDAGER
jgi:signal transduction histidine kinase